MSNLIIFKNNASSLLASSILATDGSLQVTGGQGSLFPAISAGQIGVVTLEDTSGNIEVVWCTGLTGDTLTITRAQEGTTALPFASGSRVEMRVTAGILAALLQKTGSDTLSGTTTFSGILAMGSNGSIQGGELVGTKIRGASAETDNQISVPAGGGNPTIGGSAILTAANILSSLSASMAVIQSQMIVLWHGVVGNIPAGWKLCDGLNSTPNLVDKFVVGGGGALTSGNVTGTTGSTSAGTPSTGAYVLTVADLPAHQHPFDYFVGSPGAEIGDPGFGAPANYLFLGSGAGSRVAYAGKATGGGGGHSHTGSAMAGHTHTFTATSPPYLAQIYIMKV